MSIGNSLEMLESTNLSRDNLSRGNFESTNLTGDSLSREIGRAPRYGQFSKFHVCFCGLDPGNLKFETVRTNKQHICF